MTSLSAAKACHTIHTQRLPGLYVPPLSTARPLSLVHRFVRPPVVFRSQPPATCKHVDLRPREWMSNKDVCFRQARKAWRSFGGRPSRPMRLKPAATAFQQTAPAPSQPSLQSVNLGFWRRTCQLFTKTIQPILIVTGTSVLICLMYKNYNIGTLDRSASQLLGTLASFLLVFRTNVVYSRWWEARASLGLISNNILEMASKAAVVIDCGGGPMIIRSEDKTETARLLRLLFTVAILTLKRGSAEVTRSASGDCQSLIGRLEQRVREDCLTPEEAQELLTEKRSHLLLIQRLRRHNLALSSRLGLLWAHDDTPASSLWGDLEGSISCMLPGIAGCIKIQKTPIPRAYTFLNRMLIWMLILSFPLCLVADFGWGAVFMSTLLAFGYCSLDHLIEELQDPFGSDEDDFLADDALVNQVREDIDRLLLPSTSSLVM